jgi:hypothetical protein
MLICQPGTGIIQPVSCSKRAPKIPARTGPSAPVGVVGLSCFAVVILVFAGEEHPGTMKERVMVCLGNQRVSIYVDRSSQQWVVRDPDGRFWTLAPIDRAWEHRRPFTLTDESELEPVPGHYKSMLGLPF